MPDPDVPWSDHFPTPRDLLAPRSQLFEPCFLRSSSDYNLTPVRSHLIPVPPILVIFLSFPISNISDYNLTPIRSHLIPVPPFFEILGVTLCVQTCQKNLLVYE